MNRGGDTLTSATTALLSSFELHDGFDWGRWWRARDKAAAVETGGVTPLRQQEQLRFLFPLCQRRRVLGYGERWPTLRKGSGVTGSGGAAGVQRRLRGDGGRTELLVAAMTCREETGKAAAVLGAGSNPRVFSPLSLLRFSPISELRFLFR
ncbi:hypothetical protein Droror1_Dr00002419 [Drosera rotundifolia]